MKIFKIIYYYLLCHFFPNRLKQRHAPIIKELEIGFIREDGLWYADIPYWPGSKNQLLMVSGADTFLDVASQYTDDPNYVKFKFCDDSKTMYFFEFFSKKEDSAGAEYLVKSQMSGFPKKIWLCNVSKWFFGFHPDKITGKIINVKDVDD